MSEAVGKRKKRCVFLLRFWGGILLQMIGMSVAIGAVWYVLIPFLNGEIKTALSGLQAWGGLSGFLQGGMRYLLLAGGVCAWVFPSTLFQTYYPVLTAMNVTRRHAAVGIWLCSGAEILLLFGIVAVCTSFGFAAFTPGQLPLLFAAGMAVAAVGILVGILVVRNRVVWIILLVILSVGTGIVVGFCVGAEIEMTGFQSFFRSFASEGWPAAALSVAAVVFYLLAGVAAVTFLRKTEVRR